MASPLALNACFWRANARQPSPALLARPTTCPSCHELSRPMGGMPHPRRRSADDSAAPWLSLARGLRRERTATVHNSDPSSQAPNRTCSPGVARYASRRQAGMFQAVAGAMHCASCPSPPPRWRARGAEPTAPNRPPDPRPRTAGQAFAGVHPFGSSGRPKLASRSQHSFCPCSMSHAVPQPHVLGSYYLSRSFNFSCSPSSLTMASYSWLPLSCYTHSGP